jgi:hypothetical protein
MEREIITLCGSTRFREEFREVERKLTLNGKIVLPPAIYGKSEGIEYSKEMAKKLPHLEESEAIKQIIASAELDPNGPVANRFAEYISLALTTFF